MRTAGRWTLRSPRRKLARHSRQFRARVQAALAKLLVKMNKPAEAREAYQSAIMDAQTVEPVFQADTLKGLEKSLRSLN